MSRHRPLTRLLVAALGGLLVLLAVPAHAAIEEYADYQPQTTCSPRAKAGTQALGHWLVQRRGGGFGPISRPCDYGGTSEHKEGRAFDWTLDATKDRHRAVARAFLAEIRATDRRGNTDARARRMGIMYVIWNDHMYSAGDGFAKEDYLSSSCRRKRSCSATLRHRDHMHISLGWPGARGRTSFYDGRLD
ncbi:MAG TPA: hypothetical protein VD814_02675 [Nocardioides sp.]|nr:hypothetical protein [Nocardioides sp.]